MKHGRCRMHGGLSTGPRTAEGLERSRRARWIHGMYSRETKTLRADNRRRWRELWALLAGDTKQVVAGVPVTPRQPIVSATA